LLERALRQAKGNKTKAARLLGIPRARVIRRLEYFGIE
jgi:DNA-binding protein Fis